MLLVTFCFPFLDLRYLLAGGTIGAPRWLWPESNEYPRREFVGELGRVLYRASNPGRLGALSMDRAVRFLGKPEWHSVAGRRIFADMFGQVQAEISLLTIRQSDTVELLKRIGDAQLMVPKARLGPASLAEAGFALAERYQVNSALTSEPPGAPLEPLLVKEGAGSPFIILTGEGGDVTPPVGTLEFPAHSDCGGRPRLRGRRASGG